MEIVRARLEELEIPLVEPFETSFGRTVRRRALFVVLEDRSGLHGIGECVAAEEPLYSEETIATASWAIERLILPRLAGAWDGDPARGLPAELDRFRGHRMARAAVEMALLDLAGRLSRQSVARLVGATRSRVEVGVSVGMMGNSAALVDRVGRYREAGYGRVKLKVRPGNDAGAVRALRRAFPDLRLWVDANQAYPARAVRRIAGWATRYGVEQVEQPFAERDLLAHATLARAGPFRVCLDESVVDGGSLATAIGVGALTSLNVKPGRVGGSVPARGLARAARRAGVAPWVGGMLETGIGRAHGVALAARPEFTLPADLSASARYFPEEIIDRPFELGPGSTLPVPTGPGSGVEVDPRAWRRFRRKARSIPLRKPP